MQAALWTPSMAERDMTLEPIAEPPDPGETEPTRWLGQEASSARLRNGTDGATAAVVSPEHKVASVPRNKQQHSTSHHFPAIGLPRHSTHPTIPIIDPFTVLFPSKPGWLVSSAALHVSMGTA